MARASKDTTAIGFTNPRRQTVIRATELPGTDHLQRIYVLRCGACRTEYGANGSDIHARRYPSCDGGRPGLETGFEKIRPHEFQTDPLPASHAFADDKVLNLLSWPGHGDPAFVKPFEDKYGVKVVAKEYVGGEPMLALMNQSPPGTFDVVLADAEYIHMLQEGSLIDALNPKDFPLDDYWPEFQHFPLHWVGDKLYSVLIRFGYLGMAYRTDVLKPEDVKSYKTLWDPKVKGKVGFFDWYLPTMGCLSLYDGNKPPFDISDAAFDKLKKTLFSLKPQESGFYSMADQFAMLTNGTAAVIPGIGDWVVLLLQKNGVPVDAVVPDEGGIQWTESMSIVSSSTKKDLAKAFIQYASSPEGQFRSARLPAYWASIPNKKGWDLMNKEAPADAVKLRHTFDKRNVMDEYKEGKIFIRQTPVKQSIEAWNDAWSEFKSM